MQDIPDIDDLLAAARASVLRKLLPVLADTLHYEALMVANALAIARRMLAHGEAMHCAEHTALRRIYGLPAAAGGDAAGERVALEHRLAADLRHGRFDPASGRFEEVQALLWEDTVRKLRQTSPKLLDENRGD